MDWNSLMGFYFTALFGNLTRASKAVCRSQPALTAQIRRLEETLGCKLFERVGRRKLFLTEEGARLFAYAERQKHQYAGLMEDLDDLRRNRVGSIRLAATPNTLLSPLAEYVESFRAEHPGAAFRIYEEFPLRALEMLSAGKVDFAFSMLPMTEKRFRVYELLPHYFMAMLKKGHPLDRPRPSLEEIARYPLVVALNNHKYGTRFLLEAACRQSGIRINVALESNNTFLSAEYVRRGVGVALLVMPLADVEKYESDICFVRLDHLFPPTSLAVSARSDGSLGQMACAFLDHMLVLSKAQRGEAVPTVPETSNSQVEEHEKIGHGLPLA